MMIGNDALRVRTQMAKEVLLSLLSSVLFLMQRQEMWTLERQHAELNVHRDKPRRLLLMSYGRPSSGRLRSDGRVGERKRLANERKGPVSAKSMRDTFEKKRSVGARRSAPVEQLVKSVSAGKSKRLGKRRLAWLPEDESAGGSEK